LGWGKSPSEVFILGATPCHNIIKKSTPTKGIKMPINTSRHLIALNCSSFRVANLLLMIVSSGSPLNQYQRVHYSGCQKIKSLVLQ
jgi:hypothetical protein